MALATEFEKYRDEESFRDQFLIPLLHRIGFSVVLNYHGCREFGRDIIFGEIDSFGHFIYHGLQAKFEKQVRLNKKIDDLVTDVSQAFNTAFKHPQTGEEQRISRFYVVNAGTVSEQAKEAFFGGLHSPGVRANTRFLDGKALVALNQWASYSRDRQVKEQLTGLILELNFNNGVLNKLYFELPTFLEGRGPFPMYRCRLQAVSRLLERPILTNTKLLSGVENYWQTVSIVNDMANAIGRASLRKGIITTWSELIKRASSEMINLGVSIKMSLTELLSSLEMPNAL